MPSIIYSPRTLKEIAKASLELLESEKVVKKEDEKVVKEDQPPYRRWTVESREGRLEIWTLVRENEFLKRSPESPTPALWRIPAFRPSESPLMGQRGHPTLLDDQSMIASHHSARQYPTRPPNRIIHARSRSDGPRSLASKRGRKLLSRKALGITKCTSISKVQKRMLRSTPCTRSRRVTTFFALDSRGRSKALR